MILKLVFDLATIMLFFQSKGGIRFILVYALNVKIVRKGQWTSPFLSLHAGFEGIVRQGPEGLQNSDYG